MIAAVRKAASTLDPLLERYFRWAVDQALPLWADRGFDADAAMFEEQLSFDGSPVLTVPRRVMVQARQISVYALAAEAGWFDGRAKAVAAGQSLIEKYWARDGEGGWAFSIGRDDALVDATRDLYAHAFTLFALAWLVRIAPGPRIEQAIAQTLHVLDGLFADPVHGGCWDAIPRPDALRRQNPHMHLLEAYLELYAATRDPAHFERASRLVDLARRAFIDVERGALCEHYHDDWTVAPAPSLGSVEPGHLYEWAWLLRRFEDLGGPDMSEVVASLLRSALAHGTDRETGRIVDEIGEDGQVRAASSRSWPHAEALKSLAVETMRGTDDYRPEIVAILSRLLAKYCPASLQGGWIDRLSETDEPISTIMPASTLYHLMFALAELRRCIR